MYAVIEVGGKQYKVEQGEELLVDRLDVDEGKSMTIVPMLLGGDSKAVAVTAAELKGAKVKARVEEHLLGEKIRVFKYKPKKGYRRNNGHRSRLSKITIQTITAGGKKAATAKAATPAKAAILAKAGSAVKEGKTAKESKATKESKAAKDAKSEKAAKPASKKKTE